MRIIRMMAGVWVLVSALALAAMGAPLAAEASSFTDLKGNPGLRSASAMVIGADGSLIYAKDPDTVRPIASITKLMTAMVVLDSGLDLDEKITVTKADRDLVQLTGSRLEFGATLTETELARDYNTVETLRSHPAIARFLDWIAERPPDLRVRNRSLRKRRKP